MMPLRSRCKLVKNFGISVSGSLGICMHSTKSMLDSLLNRVLKVSDPMIPVVPILHQGVEEGREVAEFQFRDLVRRLWKFRRSIKTNQVIEWMRNQRNYDLSPGFSALLILKSINLEKADRYFRCIPDVKFGFNTYAKLLRCYVEHECLEEAEAVMKEIKEFHARDITECYDLMLKLYVQMGKYEKLHRLVREIKEKYISDAQTYTIQSYAKLLRCYVEHECLEKAEAVMKEIKEFHTLDITECYSLMLKLYGQMGKYEKLHRLLREMKEKDISDAQTYTIQLNAYVVATDIEGMEKLLTQMEADPVATVDWRTYYRAANAYGKVHNIEKATAMLKKSEHLAKTKTPLVRKRRAYRCILTMHADIGNKDGIYRLWNVLKSLKSSRNSSYLLMLKSLVKLGDIEGAEKILEEWESRSGNFDSRIPTIMISAYCKWGQVDKAEACLKRLLDGGKPLDERSWDRLACGYRADNDMEKAVQAIKKAVSANLAGTKPDLFTLVPCVKYLKEKGDLDLALEILKSCIKQDHISVTSYDGLVSYVQNETPHTEPLHQFSLDEEN